MKTYAAILALAAVATPAQAGPTARDTGIAVAMVNQHRAAYGLPPVRGDGGLARVAAHQTDAMARSGTISHDAGGAFTERMRAFGVRGVAAENLGYGYGDISQAVAGWKGSYGHNANLLNPAIRRIGVAGKLGRDGRPFWTMILAQ